MTDTTITALLERLESLAVSIHLLERNALDLRAERDDAISRAAQLEAVAKDGQARIEEQARTIGELEARADEVHEKSQHSRLAIKYRDAQISDLQEANRRLAADLDAKANPPRRRIDVVSVGDILDRVDPLKAIDWTGMLDYLREPVGGAS